MLSGAIFTTKFQHSWHSVTCRHTSHGTRHSFAGKIMLWQFESNTCASITTAVEKNITLLIANRWSVACSRLHCTAAWLAQGGDVVLYSSKLPCLYFAQSMISITMIFVWAAAAKSGTKHRDNVNNLSQAEPRCEVRLLWQHAVAVVTSWVRYYYFF